MAIKLPEDIASLDQLDMIASELNSYIAAIRQMRIRNQVSHLENLRVQTSPGLLDLLAMNGVKPDDETGLETLVQGLAEYRRQVPRLTLILAADPAPALRRELSDWLKRTAGPNALLNIRVVSEIGGGVVVQTPSHIYDHSFRRRILDNRSKLREIIEHV